MTTAAVESALDLLSQGAGYSLLRAVRQREVWNQALAFPGSASCILTWGIHRMGGGNRAPVFLQASSSSVALGSLNV